MDYLILVDYRSDAERKRIDYAIERWKERGENINKPKGTIIHYRGENVDEFLDDICSRLGEGKEVAHVFAGDFYSPSISEQTKHLKYSSKMEPMILSKFLNYIMNKLGASYDGTRENIRSYTAYTKKGQVGIDLLMKEDEKTELLITLRGYGDVVSFIAERIDKELKVFLEEEK